MRWAMNEKNPAAMALGKLGGMKRTEAQKKAMERNFARRWRKKRAIKLPRASSTSDITEK